MNFRVKFSELPTVDGSGAACELEIIPDGVSVMPQHIVLRLPRELRGMPKIEICLDQGNGRQTLVPAPSRAPLQDVLERSLMAGLRVPANLLVALDEFDRCLLGLLTVSGEARTSSGRLAYLLSDQFEDVSANRVRERLASLQAHFAANGRPDLVAGDAQSGYSIAQETGSAAEPCPVG